MNKQDEDKARKIANNYGSVTFIGPFSEKKYSESDCVKAILEMAAWKEQQFEKHGYTKEQLRKMGFGFTLNGDIITPKDEEEMQIQYFKYKKQQMIEKAVEFLNDWFTDDTCNCRIPITKDARGEFFNNFKKYMED